MILFDSDTACVAISKQHLLVILQHHSCSSSVWIYSDLYLYRKMAQNHKFQRLVVTAFYLKHLKYQLFLPYIQYLHTMGYNLKHQITGRHRKGYQQGKSIINKTAR